VTERKTFKKRVRAQMEKTGESYTAARRHVAGGEDEGPSPEPVDPVSIGLTSDETLAERTGRGWNDWIAILDDWGAVERPHGEIATYLGEEHGLPGWWAQQVTVGYERARGLRDVGQRRGGGYEVNATKTVNVPVERLYEAFLALDLPLSVRTTQPNRSARFDWEDGATRVIVGFEAKGEAKSTVAVQHERLPDAEEAERTKQAWRERLAALKADLERQN
jgi:hypothetical protein